jgi:tetratricopeptide (TPR) repeat protein/predicted Ser/Thr protein kinase
VELASRTPDCLDDDIAVSFVEGLLDESAAARVEAHIDDCTSCRQHLVMMVRARASAPVAPAGAEPDRRLLAHGTLVGRYEIQRVVGLGAMGVVYAAHDTQLRRDVAVKLVRAHSDQERLLREAHALARLRHPNVITVHDVGTAGDRVFIVMELVQGTTLTERLRGTRRIADIVPLFVQAARGLHAAHAAGLVHRDFKPDNVLVGDDGRVSVTDFGLARDSEVGELAEATAVAQEVPADAGRATTITRSGAIVGTPAYMAPEQHLGKTSDARSDQFAFCVALFEALYGKRPFEGRDLRELAASVTRGDVVRVTPERRVPRRLARLVMRGLATAPENRHPSLAALADQLEARRPVAIVAAGAGVAAVAAIGLYAARGGHHEPPCADSASLVDDVWGVMDRGTLVARFSSLRPLEATMIDSSARVVDDWSASWRLARRAACTVDGAQRAARLGCLDHSLAELRAQLAVWRSGDGEVVDRMLAAATALPRPEGCDTHTAAAIDPGVGEQIARLDALDRAGQATHATASVTSLLAAAEPRGPASFGAALVAAARIEHASGDLAAARTHLQRAAHEAGLAADDATLFDAVLTEAAVVSDQGRPLDSLGMIGAADALAVRARLDREEAIARQRGRALNAAGKSTEAIPELERALAAASARADRDPSARADLAAALGALASAHIGLYHYDKAYELLSRTRDIEQAIYGEHHPELANTLHDLATTEARLGKYDDALKHLERAKEIFVATYGARHVKPALTDVSIGNLFMQQNYDEDAREQFKLALATLTAVLPADHPLLGNVEEGLGVVEGKLDHCKDAIPHHERAITILEHSGVVGTEVANIQVNLGTCLSEVGRYDEARTAVEKGLAGFDAAGIADVDRAEPWAVLADIAWHQGQKPRAIELARKAIALTAGSDRPDLKFIHALMTKSLAKWTAP